ncbi:hypothetical protein RZS08_13260, partial [Arthrospira platensis SPKY1]|nr:hypothetical protein [Arthrospira platensis SPKY1]
GTVTHNGFMLNDGTTLPVGTTSNQGQSNLVFRPQNLLLHSHDSNQKNSNLLDGVIIRNEFLGSIVRYIVRVGSNDLLVDIPHQAGGIIFNNSQVVKVEIDYSRAIVLGVE